MENNLFGNHTDYSNLTFEQFPIYIKNMIATIEYYKNFIESDKLEVEKSGYWPQKVFIDFVNQVNESIKLYNSAKIELNQILIEIEIEVKNNHCDRLVRIGTESNKMNRNLGLIWGNEYINKQYGNDDFKKVENIYCFTRDLSVSLTDLANFAERLRDFIGYKKNDLSSNGEETLIDSKVEQDYSKSSKIKQIFLKIKAVVQPYWIDPVFSKVISQVLIWGFVALGGYIFYFTNSLSKSETKHSNKTKPNKLSNNLVFDVSPIVLSRESYFGEKNLKHSIKIYNRGENIIFSDSITVKSFKFLEEDYLKVDQYSIQSSISLFDVSYNHLIQDSTMKDNEINITFISNFIGEPNKIGGLGDEAPKKVGLLNLLIPYQIKGIKVTKEIIIPIYFKSTFHL